MRTAAGDRSPVCCGALSSSPRAECNVDRARDRGADRRPGAEPQLAQAQPERLRGPSWAGARGRPRWRTRRCRRCTPRGPPRGTPRRPRARRRTGSAACPSQPSTARCRSRARPWPRCASRRAPCAAVRPHDEHGERDEREHRRHVPSPARRVAGRGWARGRDSRTAPRPASADDRRRRTRRRAAGAR